MSSPATSPDETAAARTAAEVRMAGLTPRYGPVTALVRPDAAELTAGSQVTLSIRPDPVLVSASPTVSEG